MRFTSEWWAFWSGVSAVGLTAAAAIAGLVAWYFSTAAATASGERARALELRVSEQQERAAKAEQSLLELQERLKPRTIAPEQRAALETSLKAIPDKVRIKVFVPIGDTEALEYGRLILRILRDSNWPTIGNDVELETGQQMSGVPINLILLVSSDRFVKGYAAYPAAMALSNALFSVGIGIKLAPSPGIKDDHLELMVNNKPTPK